ncbi:hypothetical protein PGQ11_011486 [Apiospora arundinis]|uniref:Uncharacterized protein n=1 Tax=Apiospora arundinis TaxID=335852 RepID=A0ABR2HZQ7_9PEZI
MDANNAIEVKPEEGTWGYYNLLPDELKLEVLKHAIPQNCAHHFVMKAPDPPKKEENNIGSTERGATSSDRSVVPFSRRRYSIFNQVLDMESPRAGKKQKLQDDNSAWLGIWNICWTVGMSREMIEDSGNRKEVWSRERKNQWRKKEEPNKARVNLDRDLIIVKVASENFEITNMHPGRNRKKFRGIKRLAFDFFRPVQKGKPFTMGPFYCICQERKHKHLALCPRALAEFLRLFGELEEVFIIYPINKSRIDQKVQQGIKQRGKKRSRDGKVIENRPKFVNKNVDELMEDTMNKFKGLALKNDLSIYEDRKKTYYQVRIADCEEFASYHDIKHLISRFRRYWTEKRPVGDFISNAQWEFWKKLKVNLLVCRDRDNDPWKVNAIVNNEIKPAEE